MLFRCFYTVYSIIAPNGTRNGKILIDGRNSDEIDLRSQASEIGFVQQSPENQIVTDKVRHELAFGFESIGEDTQQDKSEIRNN